MERPEEGHMMPIAEIMTVGRRRRRGPVVSRMVIARTRGYRAMARTMVWMLVARARGSRPVAWAVIARTVVSLMVISRAVIALMVASLVPSRTHARRAVRAIMAAAVRRAVLPG